MNHRHLLKSSLNDWSGSSLPLADSDDFVSDAQALLSSAAG